MAVEAIEDDRINERLGKWPAYNLVTFFEDRCDSEDWIAEAGHWYTKFDAVYFRDEKTGKHTKLLGCDLNAEQLVPINENAHIRVWIWSGDEKEDLPLVQRLSKLTETYRISD